MLSLLHADLLKLRKRPMGWAMLIISLVLTLAMTLIYTNLGPPEHPINTLLNYPGGLLIGPYSIEGMGVLMLIVLGATLIGSEYRYDTWKNLLTRRPGRLPFMVSKYLTLALSIAIGIITLALVSQGLALVLATSTPPTSMTMGNVLGSIGLQALGLFMWGALAMVFAVVGRSSVGGIIGGIAWYMADNILSQATPEWFSRWTFDATEGSLQAAISGQATGSLIPVLLTYAAYLVIPIVVASALFRRRDMLS